MSTLFISDLHLSPDNTALLNLTQDFLSNLENIDSLYILGDLFNTWLGDDIVPAEFNPIVEQLQQLQQRGTKTYLMVGNRDFMLGKRFAKQAGCELLADACLIDLYGTKTLLLHGDSLCIDDVKYQRYRRWTRIRALQWCFLHLSKRYRQAISDKIKRESRKQKQFKSSMIMDVNRDEVMQVMRQYNVTRLIHGHTHRPAIHQFVLNGNNAGRIVLGDWDNKISYLQCDDQQLQLVDHRVMADQAILRT